MLLYVNGNDICGGAKSINNYRVAKEHSKYTGSGNKSHPDNVMHSFGYYLSKRLGLGMKIEATVKDNETIYNEVIDFIDRQLPKLRSHYTVVVVGWAPDVDGKMLNSLAAKLEEMDLEFIFFNTAKPLPKKWKQTFSNLVDLKSQSSCFLTWCRELGHPLKEDQYPDRHAHEQWAQTLFRLMIKDQ